MKRSAKTKHFNLIRIFLCLWKCKSSSVTLFLEGIQLNFLSPNECRSTNRILFLDTAIQSPEHILLELSPIFDDSCLHNLGKRYEDDLRNIFYQWPKLYIGLNEEAEIQILNYILPLWRGILIGRQNMNIVAATWGRRRDGWILVWTSRQKWRLFWPQPGRNWRRGGDFRFRISGFNNLRFFGHRVDPNVFITHPVNWGKWRIFKKNIHEVL